VAFLLPEQRAEIVRLARGEVEARTRWVHLARQPGKALDCGGLVVACYAGAGTPISDEGMYSRHPWPRKMEAALRRSFDPVEAIEDAEPGDVLWFWIQKRRLPQHLGIWTGQGTIIHSWADHRFVMESPWDPYWQERLDSIWTYGNPDSRSDRQ